MYFDNCATAIPFSLKISQFNSYLVTISLLKLFDLIGNALKHNKQFVTLSSSVPMGIIIQETCWHSSCHTAVAFKYLWYICLYFRKVCPWMYPIRALSNRFETNIKTIHCIEIEIKVLRVIFSYIIWNKSRPRSLSIRPWYRRPYKWLYLVISHKEHLLVAVGKYERSPKSQQKVRSKKFRHLERCNKKLLKYKQRHINTARRVYIESRQNQLGIVCSHIIEQFLISSQAGSWTMNA